MAAQDQPLCCICLDVFTQPVALPCQHHFCWTCITKHWDNADRCQCPLCNRRLTSRPELQVNAGMSGLSDQLELLAQQTACCSLEPQPDAGQVSDSTCWDVGHQVNAADVQTGLVFSSHSCPRGITDRKGKLFFFCVRFHPHF
uniref:RING-type domain-containing protein n=1 Tax=Poecilia reticulata TaxID=8081 RepID=A0A3P9PUM9_POERE